MTKEDTAMNRVAGFLAVVAAILSCVSSVQATVIIETVTVGNPGNDGAWSDGGPGPERICGAVDST